MAAKGEFLMPSTTSPHEFDKERTIEIVELAPNGLGFGEGAISTKRQLENPELSGLTPEAMRIGAEIIKGGKPFVEVDADANDDGCGDGRPAGVIYRFMDGLRQTFKKSRRRAKVFGGGLIAASSMYRTAISGSVHPDETVLGDREMVAGLLDAAGIGYGGHTDNHAHDEISGCGAVDKYPQITANALIFRQEITATLRTVYGEAFDEREGAINQVFASYENQVANNGTYFSDAQGVKTRQLLERHGSVIKELNDDHLEDFIVINDIEGTTFDQRVFDAEMAASGAEGTAQAFVVDAWRGRMYADFIADQAEQKGMEREFAYQMAEADFWVRTLAVSGTLTKGDLPVFLRRYQKQQ